MDFLTIEKKNSPQKSNSIEIDELNLYSLTVLQNVQV